MLDLSALSREFFLASLLGFHEQGLGQLRQQFVSLLFFFFRSLHQKLDDIIAFHLFRNGPGRAYAAIS